MKQKRNYRSRPPKAVLRSVRELEKLPGDDEPNERWGDD